MNHFAISPLESRYEDRLSKGIAECFSEGGLLIAKASVEASFLCALEAEKFFTMTDDEHDLLSAAFDRDKLISGIKEIEKVTKHDIKAIELYLASKVPRLANWVHFGLTSEDINNLAYGINMNLYREFTQLPQLKKLILRLCAMAEAYAENVFPTHTHGQLASPSTVGKELSVFIERLLLVHQVLKDYQFSGKMNGAVGNYSAWYAAFPKYDWYDFSSKFIKGCGLTPEVATTQISHRDILIDYLDKIRHMNNIVDDLNRDMWEYISRGYFKLNAKAEEYGSSVMPHKVNPINFENSEGNICISNALLVAISDKIGKSRMQRDLSDSTVMRNIGVALAHSYLALQETMEGLSKVCIDRVKCQDDNAENPDINLELIQTVLRTTDFKDPYLECKKLVGTGWEEKHNWIKKLLVSEEIKSKLHDCNVCDVTGLANGICKMVVRGAREILA